LVFKLNVSAAETITALIQSIEMIAVPTTRQV